MPDRDVTLLKLTDEQREQALDNFLNNPYVSMMLFSARLALEEEFLLFLKGHPTTVNCPMNFLSWLTGSKYAEKVGQVLIKEARNAR